MENMNRKIKFLVFIPFFINLSYYFISSLIYFVNSDVILENLNYTCDNKGFFYLFNFSILYNIFSILFIPYYCQTSPIYLEKRIHITLLSSYNFCQSLLIMFIQSILLTFSGDMMYFIPITISVLYAIINFGLIFCVYNLYTDIYRKSLNIPVADVASPASNVETIENLNI